MRFLPGITSSTGGAEALLIMAVLAGLLCLRRRRTHYDGRAAK